MPHASAPSSPSVQDLLLMGDACALEAWLLAASPAGRPPALGEALMRKAVARNSVECLRILVRYFDPNQEVLLADPSQGPTLLMKAALEGHVACMRVLLAAGVDPLVRREGQTALSSAVCSGHLECVQELIPYGGLDVCNEEGCSLVGVCVQECNVEGLRLLVPHCDVNQSHPEGRTPLMEAIEELSHKGVEMVSILAAYSTSTQLNSKGQTAMQQALEGGLAAGPWRAQMVDQLARYAEHLQSVDAADVDALFKEPGMPYWAARREHEALQSALPAPGLKDNGDDAPDDPPRASVHKSGAVRL